MLRCTLSVTISSPKDSSHARPACAGSALTAGDTRRAASDALESKFAKFILEEEP
jgi:hypothetical protein